MDSLVEQFTMPNFCLVYSRRGTGKTWLLQNLCKRLLESGRMEKSNIVLMSSTASTSGDWSFLPDSNKRFAYDEKVLKKLLVWQRRRIELLKKRADRSGTKVVLPSLLLILDDILNAGTGNKKTGTKHHAFSETLAWIACQGRHFKITCIFAVQSPAVVQSTVIRGNADLMLIGQLSVEQQTAAFKIVTGKTFREFKQMVNGTDRYTFNLYNTRRHGDERWTEIKADDGFDPKFRMTFKNHQSKGKKGKKKKCECDNKQK
jgi:hypothetical protein